MGVLLLVIIVVTEIVLIVVSRRKSSDKKAWRKDRLIVRLLQMAAALLVLLYPAGQKWRFLPVLCAIAAAFLITAIVMLMKKEKPEGRIRTGRVIVSGILSIALLGILLVPAFLFTGYAGLPVSGKYPVSEVSAVLTDSSRQDPFEADGACRQVPIHIYYPETGEDMPLVLFSHGAFGYYQSNTSTYMELASNGYAVISMDHPHHSLFTHDSDGKLITVDPEFFNTAMTIGDSEDPNADAQDRLETYREWMDIRTGDMAFVLDTLKDAKNQESLDDSWTVSDEAAPVIVSVLDAADTEKVGLMGHSMGGAASVELGRKRNDVDAVIDLDGTMLGEYKDVKDGRFVLEDTPYELPLLEFVNEKSRAELEELDVEYPNTKVMDNAPEAFSVTFRNTEHMDYTDLPLLSPFLGNMLGSGPRDTREVMSTTNTLIREFFDAYLKGEGSFEPETMY